MSLKIGTLVSKKTQSTTPWNYPILFSTKMLFPPDKNIFVDFCILTTFLQYVKYYSSWPCRRGLHSGVVCRVVGREIESRKVAHKVAAF
jgi:hypothetical protein